MANKYQTLSGFMLSPFNGNADAVKDQTYSTKYRQYVERNRIRVHAMCRVEDSYFLHIKVPSESQSKKMNDEYAYDVVIRFFTDKPEVQSQSHLRNYYIQFYSNSPSFMYQYAYLYNKEGYLIEALYNKIDADYIDTPPEKTNANMVKSYDKSIYFACRFLSEKRFRYLDKRGVLLSKKIPKEKFFRNISDFKSVKLDQSLIAEEQKLEKTIEKEKSKKRKVGIEPAILPKTKDRKTINYATKIMGNKKVAKKKATRSTFKKK